jgi:hypothetical protein
MTQLVEIGPDRLAEAWPLVRGAIGQIAESSRGKIEAQDLLQLIAGGGVCLFVVIDDNADLLATVLTEFAQYPRKKVCRIIGVIGHDRRRWVHHLSELEDWARRHGCAAMQNIGREGWLRELKAQGYKATHLLFEKELGDARETLSAA